MALFDAGLGAQNVQLLAPAGCAIFPPQAELVSRRDGLDSLEPGEVVVAMLAEHATREPNRLLTASIGLAAPVDRALHGCLATRVAFGETEEQAGAGAEELAAEMLATSLGIDFELETVWDEKRELYRVAGTVVRTANVTQAALGDARGWWTTTIAGAILLND
jgi:arginine decarboxylase